MDVTTCAHFVILGDDCDFCPWAYVSEEHGDDGSSGGCRDCGHKDGEDQSGSFMLRFYVEPGSGDVVCPPCYLKMRETQAASASDEIKAIKARAEEPRS